MNTDDDKFKGVAKAMNRLQWRAEFDHSPRRADAIEDLEGFLDTWHVHDGYVDFRERINRDVPPLLARLRKAEAQVSRIHEYAETLIGSSFLIRDEFGRDLVNLLNGRGLEQTNRLAELYGQLGEMDRLREVIAFYEGQRPVCKMFLQELGRLKQLADTQGEHVMTLRKMVAALEADLVSMREAAYPFFATQEDDNGPCLPEVSIQPENGEIYESGFVLGWIDRSGLVVTTSTEPMPPVKALHLAAILYALARAEGADV